MNATNPATAKAMRKFACNRPPGMMIGRIPSGEIGEETGSVPDAHGPLIKYAARIKAKKFIMIVTRRSPGCGGVGNGNDIAPPMAQAAERADNNVAVHAQRVDAERKQKDTGAGTAAQAPPATKAPTAPRQRSARDSSHQKRPERAR
jgi:hypothetical protein